jgi:Phosphotransferase enzyme family
MSEPARPRPATAAAIEAALDLRRSGATYKAALERLLLELDEHQADSFMLQLKESRGAWALLLGGDGGRALFLGNALSGSVTPLAMLGFDVVLGDGSPMRVAWALERGAHETPGRVSAVRLAPGERLPFADRTFDLVVQEGRRDHPDAELERIGRGERVLVADNRLAYKRSLGFRGRYHVPGPFEWLRAVLRPARGERTLPGYRKLLGGPTRAFALYPDAREFSHVVGLSQPAPRLTIGPKERANRLKVVAKKLGLFPWFTPSFALIGGSRKRPRLERILDAVAERTGEPRPDLDILIASRSNTAVVLAGPPDLPGGWVLHVALSPNKQHLVDNHARFLRTLADRFPEVPAPALLFEGPLEGVRLSVERRLGGWSAPQITGDTRATGRMFLDVSRHLAALKLGPPRPLERAEFEDLIGERFDRVRDLCAVESTRRAVERAKHELAEALVGRPLTRVLYHADLRAKHVQVDPDGRVRGYMDWGASEDEFLPYIDLLHLIVQQRKQEGSDLPGVAWRAVKAGALRAHERQALDDHGRRLGLDRDTRRALESAYPVLVAGMAERNWDYSRPRWVHRQYAI